MIVLSGTLPLDSSKYKNIAVIGPNANATSTMQANYKVEHVTIDKTGYIPTTIGHCTLPH